MKLHLACILLNGNLLILMLVIVVETMVMVLEYLVSLNWSMSSLQDKIFHFRQVYWDFKFLRHVWEQGLPLLFLFLWGKLQVEGLVEGIGKFKIRHLIFELLILLNL